MSVWVINDSNPTQFKKINSVYVKDKKIKQIYKGNVLVYPELNLLLTKEPDYARAYTMENHKVYYASADVWVCRSGSLNDASTLYISKKRDMSNGLLVSQADFHYRYTDTKGGDMVYIPAGWYYKIYAGLRVCVPTRRVSSRPAGNLNSYIPQPDYAGTRVSLAASSSFVKVSSPLGWWVYLQPNSVHGKTINIKLNSTGTVYTIGASEGFAKSGDKGSTMFYIPGNGKYSLQYLNSAGWYCLGKEI